MLEPPRAGLTKSGQPSAAENYEERTGLATGPDPATLSAVGPVCGSLYGGC